MGDPLLFPQLFSCSRAASLIGIGIDIAEVSRVARAVEQRRFVERVYALEEIDAYHATARDVVKLSQAFALKEAMLKALGTGWAEGVGFKEVVGSPAAGPGTLLLRGRALEVARALGGGPILASATTAGDISTAVVFLFSAQVKAASPDGSDADGLGVR